jgi:predicted ATPase
MLAFFLIYSIFIIPNIKIELKSNCMHIIDRIEIKKLWGSSNVNFKCDKHYNFLIGENGTGKTTVINLIAATLLVDFNKLDKAEFEEIKIYLRALNGNKKPSITVTKKIKKDLPFFDIEYEIRPSQSEHSIKFNLDGYELERAYRGLPQKYLKDHLRTGQFKTIYSEIEKYIAVNWLSVHRNSEDMNFQDEKRNIPAIDIKINELNESLVRYFSMLAKKYSDEIIELQQQILLSIITPETEDKILNLRNSINVDVEKKSLKDMFEVLGLKENKVKNKINQHFEKFNKAKEHLNEFGNINTHHFAALLNVWRSHALVEKYENLQKSKKHIFAQQAKFIELMNELLSKRKSVKISEGNELIFYTSSDKPLGLAELSSGEKQLLIILGQALLQNEKPTIYIADEPELSLHLKWQVALTRAISNLNPNSQIIFATHSPDIVSVHQDKIIRMEGVLK